MGNADEGKKDIFSFFPNNGQRNSKIIPVVIEDVIYPTNIEVLNEKVTTHGKVSQTSIL